MHRKIFRIEAMMAGKRPVANAYAEYRCAGSATERTFFTPSLPRGGEENMQRAGAELALMRETLARHKRDLGELIGLGEQRQMTRAAAELAAAVDGMETATQTILKSVEVIDDNAKALAASLKDDYKRGLAQDIQDSVARIYESCNFQDIAGQRINKAMMTLTTIEDEISDMLTRCTGIATAEALPRPALAAEGGLLNGPMLDGDAGHASQVDIDKMFG